MQIIWNLRVQVLGIVGKKKIEAEEVSKATPHPSSTPIQRSNYTITFTSESHLDS